MKFKQGDILVHGAYYNIVEVLRTRIKKSSWGLKDTYAWDVLFETEAGQWKIGSIYAYMNYFKIGEL